MRSKTARSQSQLSLSWLILNYRHKLLPLKMKKRFVVLKTTKTQSMSDKMFLCLNSYNQKFGQVISLTCLQGKYPLLKTFLKRINLRSSRDLIKISYSVILDASVLLCILRTMRTRPSTT